MSRHRRLWHLLWTVVTLWHAQGPAFAGDALMEAAEQELARSMELTLPGQLSPYFVAYDLLDVHAVTVSASFGAVLSRDYTPYRKLRAEVRVGDSSLDSANFGGAYGIPDGVEIRLLPVEEDVLAIRREIWRATDQAYKGATEQLSAKLAARSSSPADLPPDLTPLVEPTLGTATRPPVPDAQALEELVTELSAVLGETPGLEEARVIGRELQGTRSLCTSEGTRTRLPLGSLVIRVQGETRSPDGTRIRDARWWVVRSSADLPPRSEMIEAVRELGTWLRAAREAPVESNYLGPVLFESPASVELFRQLTVPEISGTPPAQKGVDLFGAQVTRNPTARLGRRMLPGGWSLTDDPTANLDLPGGYLHDHEGVAARRVEVVRDGVVRDLLMSRTPRLDLDQSTGHGRGLGQDRRVAIPAQVQVRPNRTLSHRQLRRKAQTLARRAGKDYVLVIRRLEPPGLTEDFAVAVTGEGPLPGLTAPLEAYRLYLDGHEEPVRGLRFIGVDRRALRDILHAGPVSPPVGVLDGPPGPSRFSLGSVSGLPASWSVPPVLVTELELTGQTTVEPRVLELPP